MADVQVINAEHDWSRFRAVYNRCTIFAPYAIPLTEELFRNHVLPYVHNHQTFARIGFDDSGEGVIHAGTYSFNGKMTGHIFMFFSENNRVAKRLITETENWFKEQGIQSFYAYWWFPSPYNFILHGRESYAWAGAFPVNNAFRNNGYDLLNDIVVMTKRMEEPPSLDVPNIPGLELRRIDLNDTDLAWSARVEAIIADKKIGHCEFYDLKAISSHFNKSIGQIIIDTNRDFHGAGVAKALISYAHQLLFQRGNRMVMLATSQGLFRAIKFYEKLGYQSELIRAYSYVKEEL